MDEKKSVAQWVTPDEALERFCSGAEATEEEVQALLQPRRVRDFASVGARMAALSNGDRELAQRIDAFKTVPAEFIDRELAAAAARLGARKRLRWAGLRTGELRATAFRYERGRPSSIRENLPAEWWPKMPVEFSSRAVGATRVPDCIKLMGAWWTHVLIGQIVSSVDDGDVASPVGPRQWSADRSRQKAALREWFEAAVIASPTARSVNKGELRAKAKQLGLYEADANEIWEEVLSRHPASSAIYKKPGSSGDERGKRRGGSD